MSDAGRWRYRLAVALLLCAPAGARAQDDLTALVTRCSGGNSQLEAVCREAAAALQAGQGTIGLLATGGAPIPGAASTIGRRFGGTPRFSLGVRGGVAHFSLPDVEGGSAAAGDSYLGFGTHVVLAAGLLDGFSLHPTVGGVLSLDAFATAGVAFLPDDGGFGGNVTTWGLGASLGVLRESFTLPGVTLSVVYRGVGEVQLGNRALGDQVQVDFDPSITSVRGVIGKDLLAFGVLAGGGWDRYSSDATLAVSASGATDGELESSRTTVFGGVSLNLLLVQFSAEGGWAGGFDRLPGRSNEGYDPNDGSLFFSLAGRLTL